MPTPVDTLRRQLEMEAAASAVKPPLVYTGPADFVLQHGEWMTPTECIPGIPQHCYQNSIGHAWSKRWEYIEGYAMLPLPTETVAVAARKGAPLNVGLDVAIPHSWVRDPATGKVYEVTWPLPGRAYVGVMFSAVRADDATWNGDGSVLHEWARNFPIFHQRWTGETWHTTTDRAALARLTLSVALTGESFDPRILWDADR